jgi:DNA replication ATP-dependent helicase Dna2
VSVQAVIEDTVTNVGHKFKQVSVTNGPTTKARKNAPLLPSESVSVASQTHPTPLELKTGRSTQVMEHRAQTILYTLLMEERYRTPVPSGLLYYTQSDEVVRVPRTVNETRALIQKRNEMARYMMRRASTGDKYSRKTTSLKDVEDFLPPTINDARVCGRCYVVDTCMLYRKVRSLFNV